MRHQKIDLANSQEIEPADYVGQLEADGADQDSVNAVSPIYSLRFAIEKLETIGLKVRIVRITT